MTSGSFVELVGLFFNEAILKFPLSPIDILGYIS